MAKFCGRPLWMAPYVIMYKNKFPKCHIFLTIYNILQGRGYQPIYFGSFDLELAVG